jgi:N-acetylneuraminic acid mutarotase
MNLARSYFGAVVLDGKIYAIGGCDQVATGGNEIMPASSYTGGDTGANELYDPATGNWTSEAPMPTPREGFAIAVYQGKIYCIGGTTLEPPYDMFGAVGVNEVYDPSTNTWQTEAPMPYPVTDLQANVIDGKIYCIGGVNSSNVGSTANQVYDPATNTWSENAPLPTATFDYASAVCDGKIYIINGIWWESDYGLDLNQIYNPQNNTWSLGAPPPHPAKGLEEETEGNCFGAATNGVMAPERIYAIDSSYTQIYNPMTNSWSLGEAISPSRDGFAVVNLNDQLYVMGGSNFTGDLNAEVATETEFNLTQLYTPVGYGTIRPEISILSPAENQTFNESSFPLVFNVDRTVSLQSYSLDGKANVTLSGNETVGGMRNGLHTITVYVNDTFGNVGASQTINFTVAKPEPFPIAVVAAVSVAVILVVAGLLIIFKKHRH